MTTTSMTGTPDLSAMLHERIRKAQAEIDVCNHLLRSLGKPNAGSKRPCLKTPAAEGIKPPAKKPRRVERLDEHPEERALEYLTYEWKPVSQLANDMNIRASNLYYPLRLMENGSKFGSRWAGHWDMVR